MKVILFYKSKSISHPREEWFGRGVWNTPKTYIRRIYADAVDNPEYPVPLGYWEWTTKQRRPTLRDRYWDWISGHLCIMPPEDEFYDCTVPAQIAEKILRKLG